MTHLNKITRRELIGIIFACIGALGFASKAIFIKKSYGYAVDPETLLALRMLYSLPFFLAMIWISRRSKKYIAVVWTKKAMGLVAILGFFGYYLASYLDFLGLQYISATLERLLLFVYPTFVIVLSRIFLKKKIPLVFYPAVLLSYIGVAVAIVGESGEGGSSEHVLLGCILIILSALAYAIYLMISGEIVQKIGSMAMVAYASCIACFLSVLQFVVMQPVTLLWQPLDVQILSMCIAVFSTVIPIWLFAEAVARLGASLASMIGTLGPIFTIFLAVILLNEPFGMAQVAGAVLIIIGIVLATLRPSLKNSA